MSNSQEAETFSFYRYASNTGNNTMTCEKLNGGNVILLHVLRDLCRYILLEINEANIMLDGEWKSGKHGENRV